MTRAMRIVRGGAAALGVALVILSGFAQSAGAATSLSSFASRSIGRGIEATLGPREIVIDPLVQVAGPFTRTELNSIPQSIALAGVLFPGDLPLSVLDEEGTAPNAGSPAYWPFTLQARLDPDKEKRDRQKSTVEGPRVFGVEADGGRMRALAEENTNVARVDTARFVVKPDPQAVALVDIDGLSSESVSFVEQSRMVQRTTVRASGIDLLGGSIRIHSLESTAVAVSDGTGVPEITATLEIGRVDVITDDGTAHRAFIDDEGIHIDDPDLSESVRQAMNFQLDLVQDRIGFSISTMEEATTVDGAAGSASVGGLLLKFAGACEACPSVLRLLPDQLKSVLANLPDIPPEIGCLLSAGPESPIHGNDDFNDDDEADIPRPVPFCLKTALVPVPPNLAGSVSIAGALAEVAATPPFDFGGIGGGDGNFGGVVGPEFNPPAGETGAQPPAGGGQTGGVQGRSNLGPAVPLFGLVAEMPDALLAGLGAGLLFLAVALGIAPSLRRGSAP